MNRNRTHVSNVDLDHKLFYLAKSDPIGLTYFIIKFKIT